MDIVINRTTIRSAKVLPGMTDGTYIEVRRTDTVPIKTGSVFGTNVPAVAVAISGSFRHGARKGYMDTTIKLSLKEAEDAACVLYTLHEESRGAGELRLIHSRTYDAEIYPGFRCTVSKSKEGKRTVLIQRTEAFGVIEVEFPSDEVLPSLIQHIRQAIAS